jgi:predicted RNA methylase
MKSQKAQSRFSVAELFCGCGGFSHGFWRAGRFQTALGNDVKKFALQTFKLNHSHDGREPAVIEKDMGDYLEQLTDLTFLKLADEYKTIADPACGTGGFSLAAHDHLIVAQTRSLGATLVTANAGEFKRVKGLKVLAWKPQ